MTTKHKFLFQKGKNKSFNNSQTDIGDRYLDLNLTQNYKCSNVSLIQSNSKSKNDKNCDPSESESHEGKEKPHKLKKSSMTDLCSKYSNSLIINDKIKKDWKKDDFLKAINNSTLSLHISAYENSTEPATSDLLDDKNNYGMEKVKLKSIKKLENTKQFFNVSTLCIQNPFEIPRQQQDETSLPESMQFTASQRLLKPMDANNQIRRSSMSRPAQLPVSELIKHAKRAGEEDQATKKKRNDFREQKELEEQRKAGTAPAMVDIETGRDINPHIPEFIEKTPWYVPTSGPTLKHQRPHEERQKEFAQLNEWYAKGTTNNVAYKFRKGACENCGAMGHKKRDCFERPRKIGAKYTEEDMAPDDYVQPNLSLNYDAKRDRWNGFDSSTFAETVVKEHEEMAEIAKVIKAEKIKKGEIQADADAEAEEGDEVPVVDDDKYADEMSLGQSVDMDSRTRITVRNLRIREDTAKYLYNLNENGPYYDPKSRSMRENPFLGVVGKEAEAAKFAGENYERYSGEVVQSHEAQLFAWQARSKGIDVHATAEPTKLEILQKKFNEQRETLKDDNMKKLLESYGGEEHLDAPAKELLLAQTENYVEYNRRGNIIKGEQRPMLKSKYEEDILIGNHTTVWGSYWRDGQWGYRCCHSFMKNSYCVGEKGYANDKETFTRTLPTTAKATQIKPKPAEAFQEAEKPDITEIVAKQESNKKKKSKKAESESESSSESEEEESESEVEVVKEAVDEEDDDERKKMLEEEMENEKEKRAKKEHQRKVKREKRKRQKERKREKKEKEGKKKRRRRSSSPSSSSSSSSDSEPDLKKAKGDPELRAAIKKATKEREAGKAMKKLDDRERSYHSNYDTKKLTPAELEAYNLTRIHSSDPMASHFSK